MSGARKKGRKARPPKQGDLVICLDTGSVGIILEKIGQVQWLVSFPHGTYPLDRDDFDILKSGGN